jgi:acyl dehydratase
VHDIARVFAARLGKAPEDLHKQIPPMEHPVVTVVIILWSDEVMADRNAMLEYALKNDPLPFHIDEAAAENSVSGGLVASGGYTITLWYRAAVRLHSTIALLAGSEFSIELPNPLRSGDSVKTR